MSNYYTNQESVANIYVGLVERGWNCFGYRADQSDSMTDYYSPARWDGIAEKDGYVLLVDVYGTHDSGKNGNPVFHHANPKRNNWHIEKDGEIVAKGNGAFKCNGYLFGNYREETLEKINKFIDRVEKNIKPAKKEKQIKQTKTNKEEVKSPVEALTCEMQLNDDLNGVELKFSGIPNETVRAEMKSNGFRYSKYNKVWYAKQTEKTIMFAESLVSIHADIARDIEAGEEYILNPESVTEELHQETIEETPEQEENNDLIGRKVFGQWGVMSGWDYGIIENADSEEILVKWEDGKDQYIELRSLITVNEFTNMDAVGVYLLPEEKQLDDDNIQTESNTETMPQGKITVESIKFIWSESALIPDNTIVKTFTEAEQMIKKAAVKAPDTGAYDKTKFLITWADGQTYEGRIDIVRSDMFKAHPMKQHIEEFADYVINDKSATWYTEEDREGYREFLSTYFLEDYKETETVITEPESIQQPSNGKVLDFSSKFKRKQEEQETKEMTSHFIDNILPYMSQEEINNLQGAYTEGNEEELNAVWQRLMLSTAVKRAKAEILKQN